MNVIRYTSGPNAERWTPRLAAVAEEYRSARPRIW